MCGEQARYTYVTIPSPDKVHPPRLLAAQPKLHLRRVRNRALRRCCTLRIALCTSAHSRLSPINCTIWSFRATWNTGRSSRREELCHFFCRAFFQSSHGQAGSGASWGFWSAVLGGEVAGRRWLAGGWSRLPAVRRAGRSLLVAREDRGASPSYQRPWPPAPGKPYNYNKDIWSLTGDHIVISLWPWVGLGKQTSDMQEAPLRSFRGCVELSAAGQLVHRHNTAGATRGCGKPSQQPDK